MISKTPLTALAAGVAAIAMPLSARAAPERDPALLERKNPHVAYVYGEDFTVPPGPAPAGNAVAHVEALEATSAEGCEAGDFAGFTAGNIALIRRGTCLFSRKVTNAQDAGAAGVLVFNWQRGLASGSVGEDATIPVLFITQSLGEAFLAETEDGLEVHMLIRHTPRGSSDEPAASSLTGPPWAGRTPVARTVRSAS